MSRGTLFCTVHSIHEILFFLPGPDCRVEEWCEANHLSLSALRSADRLRDELIHILRRTELPISTATFGCRSNTLNIKRALLAGFFMQVGELLLLLRPWYSRIKQSCSVIEELLLGEFRIVSCFHTQ